jgi:hypothetical protein
LTLDRENYPLSLGTLFKIKTKSKRKPINYNKKKTKSKNNWVASRKVLSL